jgi:UDP-N-acetyl-D-glucosamine dehydrogenase
MDSVADVMASVKEADAVIIVTNHTAYDYAAIVKEANFIFDTRNATGKIAKGDPKVVRL